MQVERQNGRAGKVQQHFKRQAHAIQQPANFQQRSGESQQSHRAHGKQQHQQQERGHIKQESSAAPFQETRLGVEGETEVQKDGGRQQMHGHIAPIHQFVKSIQVAGIMETAGAERGQAKQKELARFGGAGAPVVNKQPNRQIEESNEVLVIKGIIATGALNVDVVFLKLDAVAPQRVARGLK